MARRQYTTFVLDHFLFGIEIKGVQEVIRPQDLTRVPLAPPVVEGLINLRGQIVTAIDLRRRLQLSERPPELEPHHLMGATNTALVLGGEPPIELDLTQA